MVLDKRHTFVEGIIRNADQALISEAGSTTTAMPIHRAHDNDDNAIASGCSGPRTWWRGF